MSTRRNTLEVRPVNNVTYLYSAAESEQTVSPQPSVGQERQPRTESADRQTSSKKPNSHSKLDKSPGRNVDQNERYSKLSNVSSTEIDANSKYEVCHNYENTAADNCQKAFESSENPYDDIENPK